MKGASSMNPSRKNKTSGNEEGLPDGPTKLYPDDVDGEIEEEEEEEVVVFDADEDYDEIDGGGGDALLHTIDVSSSSYSSSVGRSHRTTGSKTINQKKLGDEIAKEETKIVLRFRCIVFTFLIFVTVGVAFGVHYYVDQSEQKAFTEKYNDNAFKVMESIGTVLINTLGAVDIFTVSLTSYAAGSRLSSTSEGVATTIDETGAIHTSESTESSSSSAWPFVTLPQYAIRGSKLRV